MEKDETIRILEDWNFWKKDLATGYKRPLYLNRLKRFLTTTHIIVVTGARRSGKSFMMRQLAKSLLKEGVEKNRILFVNFEDPRFTDLNAKTLQKIYEVYLEFLNPNQRPYIFLDEVQEVKEWERWVRSAHELNKAQIIISGSNARLLSTELATLLTGRHLDITVSPLSFREYLAFSGIAPKDRLDIINQETNIKRLLRESLESGSFPEVVLAKERKEILLGYFEDILNKDIMKRFKIRKGEHLMSLTRFYLSNISSLTSFSSLEKFLNISADTIERFSGYLRDAYILYFLKRFSFKVKEQEKSPRKVYAIDTGLANTIGFRFSENLGRLAENLVFLELERRRCADPNLELYYWKDVLHREVDFVVKEGFEPKELIQVCWDINSPKTRKRKVLALLKAMEELKIKKGLIITEEYEKEEVFGEKIITYTPLWRWLCLEVR
jgi:hypothetical protein